MEKTQAKPLTAAQQRQRDKKRRTWLRAGVQLFFFVSSAVRCLAFDLMLKGFGLKGIVLRCFFIPERSLS